MTRTGSPGRRWLLALLCSLCAPGAASSDETDALVAEARALLAQDKPQAALEHLKAADAADPRVALAEGVAQYHAGNATASIATLTPLVPKLREGSPERREAVQLLGLSHNLAGHFAEALPLLEETRGWAADDVELNRILGTLYVRQQRPDKGRECFARVFGVPAESAAAHLLAAQMLMGLEQEAMAEAELRQAIQKDARLPQAHLLLGQIALFRGRLEEAVALTRQEIDLNPANGMAWSQLGDADVRQQRWDDAVAALQKSIWINPFYSAPYILLGRAYMNKGLPDAAEGMLRRAIEYDPNNKDAHYLLGRLLQHAGRTDEAGRELEIANRLQGQQGR